MDEVEEIRARVSIYDLVSQYVSLKKTGKNYKACCPFHSEKTPSFVVSPDKGLAYCFGCHKGGDIFSFVELIERVDFSEAVKILAEKANITLKIQDKKQQQVKKQVKSINDEVMRFYIQNLDKNSEVKAYLKERGLNEDTITRFKLGYAPDSYKDTHLSLLKSGFTHKDIIDGGLGIAKNLVELDIYDRFRGRLMFPIFNVHGQVVAFGGRALKNDKDAKYLNSPETALYHKSYVLYGLDQAKESIRKEDKVIVVEGYMDVLSSYQVGITNVVASSGTALTSDQVQLLKRYTKNLYFAFDSDKAGQDAADRAIEIAQQEEMDIKIIKVLAGKDPDECIKKDPELWKESINKSLPVMKYYLNMAFGRHNKEDINDKKEICDFLLPKIQKITNLIEQNHYLNQLSLELRVEEKILFQQMNQNSSKKGQIKVAPQKEVLDVNYNYDDEEYLLGLVLEHPGHTKLVIENLIFNIFKHQKTETFYKLVKDIYNSKGNFMISDFLKEISKEARQYIDVLRLFVQEKYTEFFDEEIEKIINILINKINQNRFKSTIKNFYHKISELEKQGNAEEVTKMVSKLNEFVKIFNIFMAKTEKAPN